MAGLGARPPNERRPPTFPPSRTAPLSFPAIFGAGGCSCACAAAEVASNVAAIGEIITGERNFDELGGPIRIAEVSGQTFIELGFGALVLLTALLSVNIGIVNLLPIPVLDGGHLVFLAIEAGRSRPLSPRVLKLCSLGGLLAILVIFVLITGRDLARFGLFD